MTRPPASVTRLPTASSPSWEDCRLLVESVVDYAVFMLDVDGYIVTWNLGAERIKGYTAEEIIGEHFSKFYPEDDLRAGKPERELREAAELGRVEDEGWRLRKDGSRLWANVVITALRDETGHLRGFGKVTRDLTQRRAAEESLRRSEQRFHQLVDAVSDYAIFLLDDSGRVDTWNLGARRTKGYEAEEIIGQHFSVFYTPGDRASGRPEQILDAVRREGHYEDDSWRVRKDGTHFWANVVITALRDESGAVTGFAKVTRDLTDRRRAEEELRRTEERFRLLVEGVSDYAIYLLDPEGRVTTWNLGAERMKGYTAAEIIGKHFEVFFPEDDARSGKPARELEVARTAGRLEDEGWRVRKDGSRFWANAVVTTLHDRQGRHLGFAKITRDLTARREAEETERTLLREQVARTAAEARQSELHASEARHRALSTRLEVILDGVANGITAQDRSGRLVFANQAAARICGFDSVEELLSTPPAELISRFEILDQHGGIYPPDELPARRIFRGEPAASALLHVRIRASGQDWWSLVRASPVLGPDGQPELVVNIWHDVTAERRYNQEARYVADATAALAGTLDSSAMLAMFARVLVPDLADWCSIHLVEGGELRHVITSHVDPMKLAAARAYAEATSAHRAARGIWNALRSGEVDVVDGLSDEQLLGVAGSADRVTALRALGTRAVLVAPLRERESGAGVVWLVRGEARRGYDDRDVELIKELCRRADVALEKAQLYRAAQEAAQRAELAARRADEANRIKDDFLAMVSHELRTPLNAIVGWSSLLHGRSTDPTIAKGIAVISRNAEAQGKIIGDILEVSRIITGKLRLELEPADLVAIARSAAEVLQPAADAKRITLDVDAPLGPCLLVADPERLQQVVWNLLSNAVKFTPPDGRVSVLIERDGSRLVLSVTDTGDGIDPDFLPRVFERFLQADSSSTRRVGGLGLGLAIVRHIVELHGGRVEARSAGLGQGASFIISLPVRALAPHASADKRATVGRSAPWREPSTSLRGLRVLIVDDEPDACELMEALLGDVGAVVQTAHSAGKAFEQLQRFRPHVLVSDIGMPDEDGYELMRRIRALDASLGGGIPSIALTAYARAQDRTKALSVGFTTHIGKPVNADDLLAAVENLARFSPQPRGN